MDKFSVLLQLCAVVLVCGEQGTEQTALRDTVPQGQERPRHGADNVPYVTCASCTNAINILQSLIRSPDVTDEELMDAVVDVCYALVPDAGMDPDTLCQTSIDTYGPHVIYILNVTSKTPLQICSLYNHCDGLRRVQDARQPQRPAATTVNKHASENAAIKRKSRSRSSRPKSPNDYPNALKVVHITDVHTDYKYAEGSPVQCDMPLCCRAEYHGNGSARHWGDSTCNIPHRTVDLIFDSIATLLNGHNFILVNTGDTVQHTVWDQPFNQTVDVDAYLTDRIATHFPGVYTYLGIGNHDVCPANLFHADRPQIQDLNAIMYSHWEQLSGLGAEQQTTFEQGVYYTVPCHSHAGLRILAYNSMYGYLTNWYNILNVDGDDYPAMKQFMEDSLQIARDNNEKVILLGHHPTGSGGYVAEYSQFITDIQARYSDIIVLHLLGHTHEDSYKLVKDLTTNETRGVQFAGPTMGSYSNSNPSFHILYLDHQTYEPLDMDAYHLDINADADNPDAQLQFVYRATTEYSMTDLSPQSYDDLSNRMETDRDLMNQYLYNEDTRYWSYPQCDDTCAQRTLCDVRWSDYERRQECFNNIAFD